MADLKDVQPGDHVARSIRTLGGFIWSKHTVTAVTKTQVTLDDGSRWLKSHGGRVGASVWDGSRVSPWNEADHAARVELSQLVQACETLAQRVGSVCRARGLTADQIARINAILDEVAK